MPGEADALIAAGSAALKEGAWHQAREAFSAALELGEAVEALFNQGTVLFWLGDMRGTISHLERAYAASRQTGELMYEAGCALRLSFHYKQHLANGPAAAGWLGRAARVIDENREALAPLQGELLLMKACLAEDPGKGEAWAREALDLARKARDVDAELCSLSQLGALLVEQGRTAEGMALLDEAMAASLGGQPSNRETVVFTSCQTMIACARCADFERALNWVRTSERTAERLELPFLYLECRTVHARVLFATGQWQRAEETARSVLESCKGEVAAYESAATAVLAEIRLAQGRAEEAERLLLGFESFREVAPVLARVHLCLEKPALASATIRRCLDVQSSALIEGMSLLEVLGEVEVLEGKHEGAVERGRALATSGEEQGCRIAVARGRRLEGRGLLSSDVASARRCLDRALGEFVRLGMPYEAARTRVLLAQGFRQEEPELAANETRVALATFEELGARGDADAASGFLRQLGVRAARIGPRRFDTLTRREQEVLALLAEGLSNPAIARRLYVSRKTVENHVAHILDKLGVASRAEAAAEAVRAGIKNSAPK